MAEGGRGEHDRRRAGRAGELPRYLRARSEVAEADASLLETRHRDFIATERITRFEAMTCEGPEEGRAHQCRRRTERQDASTREGLPVRDRVGERKTLHGPGQAERADDRPRDPQGPAATRSDADADAA